MNNIEQKKIVMGMNLNNELPYTCDDLQYHNNCIINEPVINNTLQQLRDNDIFIQNQYLYKTKYNVGPIQYSNDISNDYMNGTKYWYEDGDNDTMELLHKNDIPISSTIQKINIDTNNNTCNFITKLGSNLFAGFNDGLYHLSIDNKNVNVFSGWEKIFTEYPSKYYYQDLQDIFFILSNEIYAFYIYDDQERKPQKLKKIPHNIPLDNTEEIGENEEFTTIQYNTDTKKILIGTNKGNIYISDIFEKTNLSDVSVRDVKFSKVEIRDYDISSPINDISFRKNDDLHNIIVSRDGDLLESNLEYKLSVINNVKIDDNIEDFIVVGNTMYLMCVQNGVKTLSSVAGEITTNIGIDDLKKIKNCNNTLYILTATPGGGSLNFNIYKVDSDENVLQSIFDTDQTLPQTEINDFVFLNDDNGTNVNKMFIATNNGIYCKEGGKTISIATIENYHCKQIELKNNNNTITLYTTWNSDSDSDSKFKVYIITYDNNIITSEETPQINGIDSVNDVNGDLYFIGGNAYYKENTNLVNFEKVNDKIIFNNEIEDIYENYSNGLNDLGVSHAVIINNSDNNSHDLYFIKSDVGKTTYQVYNDNDNVYFTERPYDIVFGNKYFYVIYKNESENVLNFDVYTYDVNRSDSYGLSYVGSSTVAIDDGNNDIKLFEYENKLYIKDDTEIYVIEIIYENTVAPLKYNIDNIESENIKSYMSNVLTRDEYQLSNYLHITRHDSYFISSSNDNDKFVSYGFLDKNKSLYPIPTKISSDSPNHYIISSLVTCNASINGIDSMGGENIDYIALYENNDNRNNSLISVLTIEKSDQDDLVLSVDHNKIKKYELTDATINHIGYINNVIYVSTTDGIYSVKPTFLSSYVTSSDINGNDGNIEITSCTQWDINDFYDDSDLTNPKIYQTIAYISNDNNRSIILQNDLSSYEITTLTGINNALSVQICLNDGLYTSFNGSHRGTYVNGYLDQGELNQYDVTQLNITDEYFENIQPAFGKHHALFYNNNKCCIDNYVYRTEVYESGDADIFEEDDEYIINPISGELCSVYEYNSGEIIRNVDSSGHYYQNKNNNHEEYSCVVLVNVGDKIYLRELKFGMHKYFKKQSESESESESEPIDISVIPSYIINNNTNINLSCDIKLNNVSANSTDSAIVFNKDESNDKYCIYSVISGDLYSKIINISDSEVSAVNYLSDDIICENVEKLYHSANDHIISKIKIDDTTYGLYDVTLRQIITEIESTSDFKVPRNLNESGVIIKNDGGTFTKHIYTNTTDLEKIDDLYIKKFRKFGDYLVYISSDNNLYCQKWCDINSRNFQYENTKSDPLQGILDFDVVDDVIYCISSDNKIIKSYTIITKPNDNNKLELTEQDTFEYDIGIKSIQSVSETFASQHTNGSKLIYKNNDNKYHYTTNQNVSPRKSDDSFKDNISSVIIKNFNEMYILRDNNVFKNFEDSPLLTNIDAIYNSNYQISYLSTNGSYIVDDITISREILDDVNVVGLYKINDNVYITTNESMQKPVYDTNDIVDIYENFTYDDINIKQMVSSDTGVDLITFDNIDNIDKFNLKKYHTDINLILQNNIEGVSNNNGNVYQYDKLFMDQNTVLAFDQGKIFIKKSDDDELSDWTDYNLYISDIQYFQYENNIYYIVVNTSKDGQKVIRFNGINRSYMYLSSISETKDPVVKYKNIFELNNDTYLIESNKGVKRLRNNSIDTIGDENKEYKALIKYTPDALNYYYYYAIDNYVFNTKQWRKMPFDKSNYCFTINFNNTITQNINDMLPVNQHTYMFATTDGLYSTKYSYSLVNDISCFNSSQVYDIYNQMSNDISTTIDNEIKHHLYDYHGEQSLFTNISNIVNTNIDNVNNVDNCLGVNNVDIIKFGDSTDSDIISVYTHNFIKDSTPQFNYIIKEYKNKNNQLVELYLLIDTTHTYYINHVPGAGYSTTEDELIERKNLQIFSPVKSINSSKNLENLMTDISIIINPDVYQIQQIYNTEINGCSLPLKIYCDEDSKKSRSEINAMYQSLVVPSSFIKKGLSLYDDRQCFVAKCFGTDQQSIMLSFTVNNNED